MSIQNDDVLLRYCVALDAGNFDLLGEVLALAQTIPGLEEAIASLHQRFDSHESFSLQLQTYRQELQEKETP